MTVKTLRLAWALFLVLVVAALVVWLATLAVGWFLSLDKDSRGPMLALIGVLLVPIVTYFTQRSLERRRSLETALREHKTALYSEMIQGMLSMAGLGSKPAMTQPEMVDFFADITPRLMTYGSNGVIKAWVGMRTNGQNADGTPSDPNAMVFALEAILKAMRKDLGHSVASVSEGDLLRVFVNDVDDVLKARKSARSK